MATPLSVEERALNTLMTVLGGIPTSPAANTPYLTQSTGMTVQKKVPGDPLPQPTKPAAYVQFMRTHWVPDQDAAGGNRRWRVTFAVWLTGATVEAMLSAKRDVCYAVFNGEGSFTPSFGEMLYPDEFVYQSDLESTGIAVGMLTVFLDATVDHNAP